VAAARIGRWLGRAVAFMLLCAFLFIGVRCWQTSRPAVWTLVEVPSPDLQIIAAVKAESGWGYAKDFVSLRRAEERDGYDPLVVIDYEDEPSLLLRWRGDRDLDVGVPGWSDLQVKATEKDGVRLRIVRYPNLAAPNDKSEKNRRIRAPCCVQGEGRSDHLQALAFTSSGRRAPLLSGIRRRWRAHSGTDRRLVARSHRRRKRR
jgi:hypothetical protein